MITVTTHGYVSRDSMERADGALAPPWEVLVSAAIVGNFLKAPGSGSASNRPGARYHISAEAATQLLTQVEGRFTDGAGINGLQHAHCAPTVRSGYGLHLDTTDTQLTEWTSGNPTGLILDNTGARSANTVYTSQLLTKPNLQRATASVNGGGVKSVASADGSFNATTKIPYLWRNNNNSNSHSAQYRRLLWMRGDQLVVNGPNTSWIARLKRLDGSIVMDVAAVSGVATFDLMRGFGADEWVPWDGWHRLEIIEGGESGEVVDFLEDPAVAPLYPGSVLEWDGEEYVPDLPGGGLEPDPDRPASADPSSLLFDFVPATDGMTARFLRAGHAWAFRAREFERALRNQSLLEAEWIARERFRLAGELAEPPSSQLVAAPDDLSGWDLDAGVTRTQYRSAFNGLDAWLLEADGSDTEQAARFDLATNYSGDAEAVTVLASGTGRVDVGLWNADANEWAILGSFDLGAGTAEVIGGSGEAWIERRRRFGFGYDVWSLRLRGGAGTDYSFRSIAIFPAGAEGAEGRCVVHWVQWEPTGWGVNPLSAGMLAGGQLWVPGVPDPESMSAYWRGKAGWPSGAEGGWVWHVGELSGAPPYFGLRLEAGAIVAEHDNDASTVASEVSATWDAGDEIEAVATLMPEGSVHLVASVRGGAAQQGSLSADAALADEWPGEKAFVLARGTGQARVWHKRLLVLRASHLRAAPGVASQGEVMGEHRRYATRTTGLGDLI